MKLSIILCLHLACSILISGQAIYSHGEHTELGDVKWYRDYDLALEESKRLGKPVLILFQEVPGCATCKRYGDGVLSHPLLVEAIQESFIPLAIFNNHKGADAIILKQYGEPSWNNPVVRIVDHTGADVTDRIAGKYTHQQLLSGMIDALEQSNQKPPLYLELLQDEWSQNTLSSATYSMYCFWSGEAQLGSLDGVKSVESGFQGGREVVRIQYDQDEIQSPDLDAFAQDHSMSKMKSSDSPSQQSQSSFRYSAKDHLYQLRHSPYRSVPMTDLQKVRVNAALYARQNPQQYLSPQQVQWFKDATDKHPSLIDHDLLQAWAMKS